jgi:hypothetical protein
MRPGPARIHAQQHAGPVVGLGAAGAGVHFQIGVVAVGLAGQQGLQLGSRGAVLDALQLGARLFQRRLVAFLVGHFGEHDALLQPGFHLADGVDLRLEARTVARHGLGGLRVVPQRRVLDPRVQLIELPECDIPVKDAS